MSRVLSRVRVVRSEESRMESFADPSKRGDLDEKDPKSMAKWMKKMGKEMGGEEDMDIDHMVDEALDEQVGFKSKEESEE